MKTTNLMPWCLYYTLCEVNLWIAVTGFCPDPQGNQVTWWVVYQQKSLPFIHFYSDSENNQDIQVNIKNLKCLKLRVYGTENIFILEYIECIA